MEDYKVINLKLNKDVKSHHCLYYKAHKLNSQRGGDKNTSELSSRTLFVYNVPPYADESSLRHVFSCFGRVERVLLHARPRRDPFVSLTTTTTTDSSYFKNESLNQDDYDELANMDEQAADDEKRFSFRVAYVMFEEAEAIERAVTKPLGEAKFRLLQEPNQTSSIKLGLKKWISDYEKAFIDEAKISKEIDEFMKNYDAKKEKDEKNELENAHQPDDEGWITVTTKSRKANRPFTEKNIEKIQKKMKKRRQQMQLVNFYNFQMKESKKEYIAQLRKKFEEDKKKIEAMKSSRKFKPF